MFRKKFLNVCLIIRQYGTKPRVAVSLDEDVSNNIKNESFTPKQHPGKNKEKTISVPDNLVKAITCAIGDFSVKHLLEDSKILTKHLRGRHPHPEDLDVKIMKRTVREEILQDYPDVPTDPDDEEYKKFRQNVNDKVNSELKKKMYNWKPIDYNVYNSLVYLMGRVAPEYAALVRVFSEINARDPEFKPRNLFDFGSGVGTVTWAANQFWKKSFFEYFNVDSSRDMNDLAEILLQDGKGNKQKSLKGVYYRQFLPASNISYDLVVTAYSLLELPSLKMRLDTILNLWNKTNKYLVIIEHGTVGGFKVLNEIRDFLLNITNTHSDGYLFSPCPHDKVCPKFLNSTPCNFKLKYFTLPIGAKSEVYKETFSYMVFKKGSRENTNDSQWPRVIEEPIIRSKHTVCRLCTANGALQEIIFTAKKHGKTAYHCARSTKLGDRLPIHIAGTVENDSNDIMDDHDDDDDDISDMKEKE